MSVSILVGDVFARLSTLPDNHFQTAVTSPPYWGLRDYGTATWVGGDPACDHRPATMREGRNEQRTALAGSVATNSAQLLLAHRSECGKCGADKVDHQIGLEPTLGEHIDVMVALFREVRRVLRPDGTLWLNYGDCYATSPNGRSAADTKAAGNDDRTFRDKPFSTIGPIYNPDASTGGYRGSTRNLNSPSGRVQAGGYLKAKDLCMVPNRLAIALQEDGWWVRSEIIWAKPNPMPESINDRPATSHEKIFLLSKSARYHYDAGAVRQGRAGNEDAKTFRGGAYCGDDADNAALGKRKVSGNKRSDSALAIPTGWDTGPGGHVKVHKDGRRPKIRASDLASPRHAGGINHTGIEATPRGEGRNLRNYEPAPVQVWEIATRPFREAHFATFPPELAERCILAGCPVGGHVLDPFGGAGTTGLVADRLKRDCTMIELNPDYAEIARARIASDQGMFVDVEVAA